MQNHIVILILLFSTLTATVHAKVRAQCECRHARSQQTFPLTVDFLSGGELTKLVKDSNFHPTGAYAVVWLGKGKNAVVKLDDQYFSNPVRSNEVRIEKALRGTDFSGIEWVINPSSLSKEMKEGKALASYSGKGSAQARPRARQIGDTYPGGQAVREANKFFYPNGQELNDPAALYYPNGKNRSIQGRDYYPNGQQVSSQGQFFYPNGKRLTRGSSAGQAIQYLSDKGDKLSRAPSHVTVKEGSWTYYFSVYNGRVVTDQFQAEWRSPHGQITISVDGAAIGQATVR